MARKRSTGAWAFEYYARSLGVPMVPELRFHAVRRWRFDYAFPTLRIAVEVEGVSTGKSRHTTIAGYRADCEKYREAAIEGWIVLRYTQDEFAAGRYAPDLARAFGSRQHAGMGGHEARAK